MYETFFGLAERPFDLTPNPRYLLLTATHREALANLEYGLASGTGLTLLIGEAGTGKTTLVRRAIATRDDCESGVCVYLNNPMLTREEFYQSLADGFGLGAAAAASKAWFVAALERQLRQRHGDGAAPVLVIDEAQSLPDELLEEIRLLANIETDTQKLLLLVLTGQPELAQRLNDPGLRQLKQRVALRCNLEALTRSEAASYIAGRIRIAGGDPRATFTREAVMSVHQYSRGIPRTISVICGNALLTAFAAGRPIVDAEIVRSVAHDFDLAPSEERTSPLDTPLSPSPALRRSVIRLPRWMSRQQEPA